MHRPRRPAASSRRAARACGPLLHCTITITVTVTVTITITLLYYTVLYDAILYDTMLTHVLLLGPSIAQVSDFLPDPGALNSCMHTCPEKPVGVTIV